jgi:hypothetical protein
MAKYIHICKSCCAKAGINLATANMEQFQKASSEFSFETDVAENAACPVCESFDCHRMPAFSAAYVRGYGFMDKKGMKNDMNLYHLQNKDPYAAHRTATDKRDLESRIRRSKDFKPKTKSVYVK